MAQYPASGSAAQGKPITKSNAAGSTVLYSSSGAFAPGVNGSGVYSPWLQVDGSLSADTLITGISVVAAIGLAGLSHPVTVDVGIGGAGSEAVIGTVQVVGFVPANGTASASWLLGGFAEFQPWLRVAPGQRVAIRGKVKTDTATGVYHDVVIFSMPYANLEGN